MCNYKMIAPDKEDYGISIAVGFWAPATMKCHECSLKDKVKHDSYNVKDDFGVEYTVVWNAFTCAGDDYPTMMRHVAEHIKAGEKIHPSVMRFLDSQWYDLRMSFELHTVNSLFDKRMRSYVGDLPDAEALEKLGYHDQRWSSKFMCQNCGHVSKGHTEYTSSWKEGEKKPQDWCVKCSNCGEFAKANKWAWPTGWESIEEYRARKEKEGSYGI